MSATPGRDGANGDEAAFDRALEALLAGRDVGGAPEAAADLWAELALVDRAIARVLDLAESRS